MTVFFWDPSKHEFKLAVFCQKPGLGLADLAVVYQLEDWFMVGNSLNSCPDTGSEIKSAFSYIIKQK